MSTDTAPVFSSKLKGSKREELGKPEGDIIPQTLVISDSTKPHGNDNRNSRARSDTVASALSSIGFRSILNSNSATTSNTNNTSSSSSNTPLSNNNSQTLLAPISSRSEEKKKRSSSRLNASISKSSSSSFLLEEDEYSDSDSQKNKVDHTAKKRFYRLFGRHKDHGGRANDFKGVSGDLDSLYGKIAHDGSSLMDNHFFDDLLSLKDLEHDLVNVSKILNHGGNNLGNNMHSKSANNSGVNTTNLDHLMKQDAMLSEREYHYMYDLLKNVSSLESQFVTLNVTLRNKVLNNMLFIINDINYAVINNDHILPKMENLNKIIFLFIKLSFMNFSMEYDCDSQNNAQGDKTSSAGQSNNGFSSGNNHIGTSTSFQNSSTINSTLHTTTPVNVKLVQSIITADTSSSLFELNVSLHKLEFITKKFYKFTMRFYNKIFKDLVYMIENQLIYENNDEKILNNSIKRLNLIWYNFNSHYIPNIMVLNNEFDTFTKTYLQKFDLKQKKCDLKTLLLEIFRDCVIMPIFENYDSIYFKHFLIKQQEINNNDKLVFLQCLGILQLGIVKEVEDKNQLILKMLITSLRENMIASGS